MINLASTKAQDGLGQPIYFQNFGKSAPGALVGGVALPAGVTSYKYSQDLCPSSNSYSIINFINNCFNGAWIPLASDFTSDYDTSMSLGNMMLVNDSTHTDKILYVDTVNKALCPGTSYEFSAGFINVEMPASCFSTFPVFSLHIEDEAGKLLFNIITDPSGLGYANPYPGYKFRQFNLDFTMPAGVKRLVLKILVLNSNASCGADFAIDDIKLSAVGPIAKIAFENEPAATLVKSVCFQQNKTIGLNGSMTAFYNTPVLQWQQSTDDGTTWTDIPGATTNNYSKIFSIPDTFLFRLSGGDATNISNPNCRVVSNIMKVEVDGIPVNFKVTNNSPICAGEDLQFLAEGGSTYTWTGPNGFHDNIPFPHISFSQLKDSGRYYVTIISPGGCKATGSTDVTMRGIDVNPGPDTSICKGNTIGLHAGANGVKYVWSPQEGLSDVSVAKPTASPVGSTDYAVTVTDSAGCSNSGKVTVKLLNSVTVKAGLNSPDYVCRSVDTASFADASTGNITSWQWDFGNGQMSDGLHPPAQKYFIANNVNSYVVRLVVADSAGCGDTAIHILKVADNCYIAVPSAFSPNGDGLNDYLYPLNAYKAKQLMFRVFNRNGKLIFETKDWTNKWDGTFKGEPQPAGNFIWTLVYYDEGFRKISLSGSTILLR